MDRAILFVVVGLVSLLALSILALILYGMFAVWMQLTGVH